MVEISAMLATHVRMDWGLIVIGKQFTMWMPTESRIVLEIVFSFTYCSVYSPEKKDKEKVIRQASHYSKGLIFVQKVNFGNTLLLDIFEFLRKDKKIFLSISLSI